MVNNLHRGRDKLRRIASIEYHANSILEDMDRDTMSIDGGERVLVSSRLFDLCVKTRVWICERG
jgi:hypothetical protein